MLERVIEFVGNHYILVSGFIGLAILLIMHETKRSGRNLSSREVTALINRDEAVVLDIRQQKDFSAGHIVDSIHIPAAKLKERIAELEPHKDKTVIVVCASGMTAGATCTELKNAGFNTARLSGGIAGWRSDNLPTAKKIK